MNVWKNIAVSVISIPILACSSADSEDIKSSGIHAEITALANGNGNTHIKANLTVGSGGIAATQLDLSNADRLIAYAGGQERQMSKSEDITGIYYQTTFNIDSVNTEFRVSLERSEDASAPNSVVMLPSPFSITSAANQNYARDENIVINWEPAYSPNLMHVFFTLECTGNGSTFFRIIGRATMDDGDYTINASQLLKGEQNQFDDTGGCSVKAKLQRRQNGRLDPNYGEGGYIRGIQERLTNFSIQAVNVQP